MSVTPGIPCNFIMPDLLRPQLEGVAFYRGSYRWRGRYPTVFCAKEVPALPSPVCLSLDSIFVLSPPEDHP